MSKNLNNTYIALNEPFYCRTMTLQKVETAEDGVLDEMMRVARYIEAYQTDPLMGLWTVKEVQIRCDGEEIPTFLPEEQRNIPFISAMKILAEFESRCVKFSQNGAEIYEILGDDAEKMGYTHYLAYAEREGLVVDTNARLHKRPHALAMPENCVIKKDDLERANARWEDKDLLSHVTPLAVFRSQDLSELFARSASPGVNPDDITNRTVEKRIEVLTRFMTHLEQCYKYQDQYTKEFRQLGRITLIESAQNALNEARDMIVKKTMWTTKSEFKDVGMPYIDSFKNFVDKQSILLILLHVQALQTINNERRYDQRNSTDQQKQFELNSDQIEERLPEAEKLFRNLGATDSDIENMRHYGLMNAPQVSEALTAIAKDFSEKKEAYFEAAQKGKRLRDDAIIPMIIKAQLEDTKKVKIEDLEKRAQARKPGAA